MLKKNYNEEISVKREIENAERDVRGERITETINNIRAKVDRSTSIILDKNNMQFVSTATIYTDEKLLVGDKVTFAGSKNKKIIQVNALESAFSENKYYQAKL